MEKKKEKIVSAVATIGIILMLFGATYAYFVSRVDAGKITDVEITANTVDVFSFETGDPISLSLDQETFAEGTGDKLGLTFAKATLTPNNKTNTATDYYYLYLNISDNTFSYSLGSDKPEILLQVTDADGATVTSLDGLTYTTITNGAGESISGFDVTTKTGLITLVNNKEITANIDTKEETWSINVVFINYNENQAGNAGNNFKAKLMIQEEEVKPTLAEWVIAQYTGTQGENNLYYHNGSILGDDNTILDAEDSSYRYAGSSETTNNFVCFGSDIETCPNDNLYRIIGVFDNSVKLIKWDYATSELLGTDGDYVITYEEYGNYGTSNGINPTTEIGMYWWNNNGATIAYNEVGYRNVWMYSQLNTINLNKNYLDIVGSTWVNKIAQTTWKVGGSTWANMTKSGAKTAYINEIISPNTDVESTYNSKIGLMYVSDYYYGASPIYWEYVGYSPSSYEHDYSEATNDNWMYMGLYEWTMVRVTDEGDQYSLYICEDGDVCIDGVDTNYMAIRPVFYLNSDVTYVSGSGTKTNPIIID